MWGETRSDTARADRSKTWRTCADNVFRRSDHRSPRRTYLLHPSCAPPAKSMRGLWSGQTYQRILYLAWSRDAVTMDITDQLTGPR